MLLEKNNLEESWQNEEHLDIVDEIIGLDDDGVNPDFLNNDVSLPRDIF